jgi:hypothetical protein
MRDAREINEFYQRNINPLEAPTIDPVKVGPVSCFERHRDTTSLMSISKGQRYAYGYAKRYRPEHLYTSLMPGLPLWLLWPWSRAGVPCTAVVRRDQLNAFPELSALLHDAWDLCEDHIIVSRPEDRDDTCRANGTPITGEHVLHNLPPDSTIEQRKGSEDGEAEHEVSGDHPQSH